MDDAVQLRGVRTHNLENFDCDIPHHRLTAVTGVSGSGKSSLAFDTLYSEGRRRYTESLSTYARQFLQRMSRPPIDAIHNVQPAVALEQTNEVSDGRSTVGTVTEIDEHLHLMFTHGGTTRCLDCDLPVYSDDPARVAERLAEFEEGTRLVVVAGVDAPKEEHRGTLLEQLVSDGYRRLYIDRETVDVTERGIEQLLDRETYPVLIDRLVVREGDEMRMAEAVEAGMAVGGGKIEVYEYDSDAEPLTFDRAFRCNGCGTDYVKPQPALFSFNSSLGACDNCSGFGKTMGVDYKKVIPNPGLSIDDGAIACFQGSKYESEQRKLRKACKKKDIPTDVPFGELDEDQREFIKYGGVGYRGISGFFNSLKSKQYKTHVRIFLARYRGYDRCQECRGTRLSEKARRVRFDDHLISDFWSMRIEEAREYFDNLDIDSHLEAKVEPLLEEITHRLHYLDEIGLGYLQLGRQARTLSGGEMQRIELTSSLGRALTDTLYVLDEPTAGLHARDSERLLEVLRGLRDVGNTVVVVEHDPEIVMGTDHVIELGPVGGENGGSLTYTGPTADYSLDEDVDFTRADQLAEDNRNSDSPGSMRIENARQHNLEDITVEFPKQRLSVVTGVSGSGKSTLMDDVLYNGWRRLQGEGGVDAGDFDELVGLEGFDSVELMDQSSIGRSSRSNAMSYTNAFGNIRKLFAGTKAANEAGLTVGDFSFNTPGGRCSDCDGTGTITVEMHFMADVEVPCKTCEGKQYGPEVLDIEYRGKTIADVFEMTVDEAMSFFEESRAIQRKLRPLQEVGLGYLRLGQTTDTYSGGEAQRLKLATYIAEGRKRGATEPKLFVFDEPTIGLHLHDISVLLVALRKLVELGHTVVAIEHNIDFVARCDHVVDLGPGAGPRGGEVVGTGRPEEIAEIDESVTGEYLAEFFADG